MIQLDLKALNSENKSAEEVISYILKIMGPSNIALASSLSIEDQVLTHMILNINPKARIFFIDTGRHFQKTYDLMEETMRSYKFNYEVYAPESGDIEEAVSQLGPNFSMTVLIQEKNAVKSERSNL